MRVPWATAMVAAGAFLLVGTGPTVASAATAPGAGIVTGPNLTLTNADGTCSPGGPCPAQTFTLNAGEVIQVNLTGGTGLYWTQTPSSTDSSVVALQSESTDANGDATAVFKVVGAGSADLTAGATACPNPPPSGASCPTWVQPWTVGIVGKLPAAMSMSVSPTTSVYGQPIKLVAGFATSPGTNPVPTGTVDFYDNDGATHTLIGSAPLVNLDPNGDWATMTISWLSGGTHVLTASYAGDQTFSGSNTVGVFVTIDPAPTKLSATPAVLRLAGPTVYAFTVSANLTRSDTGAPLSGQQVSFSAGSTSICTATTDTSGQASCSGLTSAPAIVLSQGYTATFAGTADYQKDTAEAPLVS
jgi:hypothetical protein